MYIMNKISSKLKHENRVQVSEGVWPFTTVLDQKSVSQLGFPEHLCQTHGLHQIFKLGFKYRTSYLHEQEKIIIYCTFNKT